MDEALYKQPFGKLLLAEGLISEAQLREALSLQETRSFLRLGEILQNLGYLTAEQLATLIDKQQHSRRLGQILVHKGLLTPEQLAKAIDKQRGTDLLLGHLVVKLGYCDVEQVLEVLQEQRAFGSQPS